MIPYYRCVSNGASARLYEEKSWFNLLKKASASNYIVGAWSFAFFLILMPPVFMSISEMLFGPIMETLWGTSYHTYPGMLLCDVVGYVVVSLITIPISLYFAHNMYHVGKHLRFSSLRFVGIIAVGLVATSIVLVPFIYQNALDRIAGYQAAIDEGILYTVAFDPLGLLVIQAWVSVSLLIASFTLAIAAGELGYKTCLTHFIAAAILTSIAFVVALPFGLAMMLTPVHMLPYGGNNELLVLVFAAATILFGVGLGQLGRQERQKKTVILPAVNQTHLQPRPMSQKHYVRMHRSMCL